MELSHSSNRRIGRIELLEPRRLLAGDLGESESGYMLSMADVETVADAAVQRWVAAGASAEQVQILEDLR